MNKRVLRTHRCNAMLHTRSLFIHYGYLIEIRLTSNEPRVDKDLSLPRIRKRELITNKNASLLMFRQPQINVINIPQFKNLFAQLKTTILSDLAESNTCFFNPRDDLQRDFYAVYLDLKMQIQTRNMDKYMKSKTHLIFEERTILFLLISAIRSQNKIQKFQSGIMS